MASDHSQNPPAREPSHAVDAPGNIELARADAVLRESEEKFLIAFENAPMGMSIIGPKGEYLAVNPALCSMFGYSRAELLKGTLHHITHPDDIERGNLWIRKMMSGDYSEPEFEKRYIHRDGHVVWGLVRAQWVRNEDGSPRMSVVHILDITERKRAEQVLLNQEHRLREAHAIARMGHFQIELSDNSMSWADSLFDMLEIEPGPESPTYATFVSRIHPEDRAQIVEAHRAVVKEQSTRDLVCRLLLPSERIKYVRMISRAEYESSGKPGRISGILQDVTQSCQAEKQRARLEEQLHQAQKMEALGLLAGGIAHDFNNLLTVIGGNASLALLDVGEDSKTAELLLEIVRGADSAAELTRQLLAVSRKQVIAPRTLNLNQIVTQSLSMLRRLLGEGVELRTELDPELGQALLDQAQVERILFNLAANARDAMKDGGTFKLQTKNVELDEDYCRLHAQSQAGSHVMLALADTGIGMSKETQSRVFEPFFTTKAPGCGTGLGLATVYGAVRQNRGFVEVYSELGWGTAFRIYFPRVDQPADRLTLERPTGSLLGHETILIVEDDARVRSLATRVLNRHGYRVYAFSNGKEALAEIESLRGVIDLIVTDVVMPEMNGRIFAERASVLHPEAKVLYTSGYSENVIGRHGALDPGLEFLPKPYTSEQLTRRVREVLQGG